MNRRATRLASKVTKAVGIGVSQSLYVDVVAIAKPNGNDAPYCVPNELICARLAQLICLPVPPCTQVDHPADGSPMFASLDFTSDGGSLPDVEPDEAVAALPNACAGLLMFDAWVTNSDRHNGNLAVEYTTTPPRLTVFDHSHALFGHLPGQGAPRLAELRDRLGLTGPFSVTGGNRHCLLDWVSVKADIYAWIERIQQVPRFQIEEACNLDHKLGATAAELAAALDFLLHRQQALPNIVQTHHAEFKRI
ncbi:MAG: hypothetical protein EOO70_06645, partial [Myxococcaceae bacterium]